MKKIIILLFLLSSFILAKYERVYVAIDPNKDIKSGSKLQVILVAVAKKGAKFKFPKITSIGEYKTVSKPKGSVSYSIEQKGNKKVPMEKRTLTITIRPTKTFDMPSFTVKINGKKFNSIPFRVQIKDKILKKAKDNKKKSDKKVEIKKDNKNKSNKNENKRVETKKDKKVEKNKKQEPKKVKKEEKVKKVEKKVEKDKNSPKKIDKKENNQVKKQTNNIKKEAPKVVKTDIIKKDVNNLNIKKGKKVESLSPKPDRNKVIDFTFKMSSNKKVVVEKEPFIVTVKLIEPIDLAGAKLTYTPPLFKGFKVVPLGDGKTIEKEDSITRVIDYLLTPKKEGTYIIKPALANIELELTTNAQSPFGFFGNDIQTKELKTNPIKVVVKPKPEGVDLVGKFLIKEKLDKLVAKANKPFTYFVVVHGFGDLDDFELPKFKIPGLTIYDEDSKLEHKIENGKLLTTYSKKFTFISDKDFEIPSIKLKVYEPKTGKIDIISTKSYKIKVKHSKSITKALLGVTTPIKVDKITESIAKAYEKNNTNKKEEENFLKTQMLLFDKNYYKRKYAKDYYPFSALIGAIILGIILGAGAVILIPSIFRVRQFRTKEESIIKNYEDALNTLYPYTTTSKDIEEMVEKLYEVTNGNKDIVIDNYLLKKMLKKVKEKTL